MALQKRPATFQEINMTNVSKAFALAISVSGTFLVPVQVFAEEVKTVPVDDTLSNEMSQCLNFALAANDMPAVRDCDRFDPISPIFGRAAATTNAKK
jgi:hypothetical protein